MSEERVKFSGRDVMEALAAAREHFGATRRQIGYEALEKPGVGKVDSTDADAVEIEAWVKEGVAAEAPPEEYEDRPRRYRDRDDRGGRGGRGDRGDRGRGGRGRGDRDRDRDRDRGPRRERVEDEEPFEMPAILPPADVADADEILRTLSTGLLVGLELDLTVAGIVENEIGLRVKLDGADVPLLLESNAEGLEMLQYLANRILQKDGRLGGRVSFDAGDHRAAQEARLLEKAMRFAEEAVETGQTRKMPPMGPYERRLVHMKLSETEGIRTFSTGSGFSRRLHIAPKKDKAAEVESQDVPAETNDDAASSDE